MGMELIGYLFDVVLCLQSCAVQGASDSGGSNTNGEDQSAGSRGLRHGCWGVGHDMG